MRLAVTIDTEADNQWQPGIPVTTHNVMHWAPFQDVCDRHGVKTTYLIATEIAEDERAVRLLGDWRKRGTVEIGAHLHPWTTPPFSNRSGLRYNDLEHAYPSQLPDDLLREKTQVLTGQIADAFGFRPTSYRAGRFGLDDRGAEFLAREGYVVDSSVTPYTSWRTHPGLGGVGGPDFRHHSPHPFRIASVRGAAGLLEIPVTVTPTYKALRTIPGLLEAYRWLPVRAVRKLLLARWLRPQPMWLSPDPRYDSLDLRSVTLCAAKQGADAMVMAFHSSELMPGCSPFRRDAQSIRELLDCLDAFFGFVRQTGGQFRTLTALAAEILAETPLPAKPVQLSQRATRRAAARADQPASSSWPTCAAASLSAKPALT